MSQLDEELERAAADETAQPVTTSQDPAQEKPKRSLGLLAVLLGLGGLLLLLVFNSFEGAAVYSKGVDELLTARQDLIGRSIRVEGMLVPGSLRKRDKPCEYRFELMKNRATIPVRYSQCIVPDTFRDIPGMEVSVTAEGQLAAAGHFQAKQIMAKCPSKYEEKMRGGEAVPYNQPIPPIEPGVDGPTSRR